MGNLLTVPIPLPCVRPRRVWIGRFLGVLGAGFALPLLLWAYAGAFSRMEADDYAMAASARHLGLWASQWYWYNHWHGRFAMQFSLDGLAIVLPGQVGFLPPLVLAGWTGALALALRFGAALLGISLPWLWAASLSAAGVWTALWLTPQPEQATWWESGLLTYLVPLAGLWLWAGLAARVCRPGETGTAPPRPKPAALLGLALLAFVTGGFSETATGVFLLWLSAGALLLAVQRDTAQKNTAQKNTALPVLLAGLAGAAAAAVVMVHASGNLIREAYCQPAPNFAFWWAKTWHSALFFTELRGWVNESALAALGGAAALAAFGSAPLPRWRLPYLAVLGLVLIPTLCFASVVLCFGLTIYAASSSLPPRAELMPAAFVAAAVFSMAATAGLLLRAWTHCASYRLQAALAAALALPAAACTGTSLPDWAAAGQSAIRTMTGHARLCDRQTAFLAASSGRAVCLGNLSSPAGLPPVGGDPSSWPNRAVASYYGLPLVVESGYVSHLLTPAEEAQFRRKSRIVPGLTPLVDGVPLRFRWLQAQQAVLK